MTEEHMPDCAALVCHALRYQIPRDTGIKCLRVKHEHHRESHAFEPGTCNCELGRLRAENEKLKAKVNSLKTKLNISSDVAELEFDKAEELRDWQRRALTWVRFARKEVKYFDGYINGYGSESEIDKLIAEAEEQPDE